jgi:hypothetical protein
MESVKYSRSIGYASVAPPQAYNPTVTTVPTPDRDAIISRHAPGTMHGRGCRAGQRITRRAELRLLSFAQVNPVPAFTVRANPGPVPAAI